MADRGAGDVHRGVASADQHDPVAEVVDVGVLQVVDRKVDMTEAFALDVQRVRPPDAGADEDRLVAVAEEVVNLERLADVGVGADFDILEPQVAVLEIVEHALGQAEFGDAVAQHAADLIVAFKDRDVVAVPRQNDRDGQPGRSGADDRDPLAVGFGGTLGHLGGVGGGDVVFNDREMYRRALDAAHAVAFALVFVVADQAADGGQGVVFKQHPAGFVELVGLEQPDHFRDVGVDRAALLAARVLAAQAQVGFVHYMQCHCGSSLPKSQRKVPESAPILRHTPATKLHIRAKMIHIIL